MEKKTITCIPKKHRKQAREMLDKVLKFHRIHGTLTESLERYLNPEVTDFYSHFSRVQTEYHTMFRREYGIE